ncbi:MAG: hypothetical protein CMO55_14610 [Verrucomicrobiales bacterium]|nr:hypothetical protein [Verrucomicrobiales bacterium]
MQYEKSIRIMTAAPTMPHRTNNRKTTPKVKNGVVQTKNRQQVTRLNGLAVGIDKSGGRQVLTKDDAWKFLRLIPDWKRVSTDLDLIYLSGTVAEYEDGYYEYPSWPTITLNSWEDDLSALILDEEYVRLHRPLLNRLGVEITTGEHGITKLQFNEDNARAWQLLHIFLHELGHHHYRIKHGRDRSAGSEKYAEGYAFKMEKKVWRRYCEAFDFHPPGSPF